MLLVSPFLCLANDQVGWYICTVVACVFLVARLAVRWRLLKRLYLDDLLVALAALCLVGDLAIQHYMFTQGMLPNSYWKKERWLTVPRHVGTHKHTHQPSHQPDEGTLMVQANT